MREIKRGRQSARDAEQSKAVILDVASRLFADRGYDGTSLRDIAERAEITHGLLRHHFGSKFEIWQACTDSVFDAMQQMVAQPMLTKLEADPVEAMRLLIRNMVMFYRQYPLATLVVKHESSQKGERLDYFCDQFRPLHEQFLLLIREVKRQGYLNSFSEQNMLTFVSGLCSKPFADYALLEQISGQDVWHPDYAKQYADQLIELLLPSHTA